MWHEARKQEKKIRGMLVDYKKRAERRREYYERIKQDPTQFIQIHGRACKIHLDPAIHYAAEAPGSMMPWRGDKESMIDRFDVRAHLDDIPSHDRTQNESLTPEQLWEERQANYERYRILVQNEFLTVNEEKFLNQIRYEELYGPVGSKVVEDEKKSLMSKKAAIGFIYEEPGSDIFQNQWPAVPPPHMDDQDDDSGDDSDSDIDLDLTVDVLSLTNEQQRELNVSGIEYGMNSEDFMKLMSRDLEEAEELRVAKEHEDEKAMFSGRKSRKERRALKKKHLDRTFSPPSYAARSSPTYQPYRRLSSKSHSKSPSPPCSTSQIKFITSFGEDSEGAHSDPEGGVIIIPEPSGKPSSSSRKGCSASASASSRKHKEPRRASPSSRERSRSSSRSTHRRRRSNSNRHSRSRSPKSRKNRDRYASSHHRKSSRSYSRSRSRSPERVKGRHHGRSRSRSQSKSGSSKKEPRSAAKISKTPTVESLMQETKTSSPKNLPSPPRRRYYGRRAENSDSEEGDSAGENGVGGVGKRVGPLYGKPIISPILDIASEEFSSSVSQSTSSAIGNESNVDKNAFGGSKMTPKERLRKKMQALLKKQYKADKKLEKERAVKAEQERLDREEELREIAIKLRRREREKRHRLHGDESNTDESGRSRSRSRSKSRPRSRSRSTSKTPPKLIRRSSDARHRERDASYERETEKDAERLRMKDREKDSRERDTRKYTTRSRSRERERERHLERGKERYRLDRDHRGGREEGEGQERQREDSYRERDIERSRNYDVRYANDIRHKAAGYDRHRTAGYDGPRPAVYDEPRPAGYDGPRPAGYDGPRPAGYAGPRPAGYDGPRPAGYDGPRPTGYDGHRTAGYDGHRPASYDGHRPGGYDGHRPAGYDRPRSAGYDGPRPAGYVVRRTAGSKEETFYHSRDGRYMHRIREDSHLGYDDYSSGSDGKKIRLVDY